MAMRVAPPAHARPDHLRRVVRALVMALVVVIGLVVLVFGVFPTRTWLDQRSSTRRANERLGVLEEQNSALDARIAALSTDTEIERLARQWYDLVRPGEEAYAVLPSPRAAVELPSIWPFGSLVDDAPATTSSDGVPKDH
jgi:cell division protein FtsB